MARPIEAIRVAVVGPLAPLLLTLFGAIDGLLIYRLVASAPPPASTSPLAAALIALVVSAAAVAHFAWSGDRLLRLLCAAAGVAIVLSGLTAWVYADTVLGFLSSTRAVEVDDSHRFLWSGAFLLVLYILGPFIQIAQRSGSFRFPYSELFAHSWANVHIGLVGAAFVGVVWIVLRLWGALFDAIGITIFSDAFTMTPSEFAISTGAFAYGIEYARARSQLILNLRAITLGLMRLWLPVVAVVALAFTASVPFRGLALLWQTEHGAQILLLWAALMIVLLNAVYQDGSGTAPYSRNVRRVIEAAFVVLPVFAAVAIYGLALRIDQHGLTVSRVYGVVGAAIIGLYCVGYAYSAIRRGDRWFAPIEWINLRLALTVVSIALLLQLPTFDPYRLSARNQFDRLVSGRVPIAEFDFGYLRFDLGRAGLEQVERLHALQGHPELATLSSELDALDKAESRWAWRNRREPFELTSVSGEDLPSKLEDAVQANLEPASTCRQSLRRALKRYLDRFAIDAQLHGCLAFPIPDSELWAVYLDSGQISAYGRSANGDWREVGRFERRSGMNDVHVLAALMQRDVAAIPHDQADLRIGQIRFYFVGNEAAPTAELR